MNTLKYLFLNFYKNGSILLYLTSLAPCMFVKFIRVAYSFTVQQDIPLYVHVWMLSHVQLCNPMDCSPPRLPCPWNFPGKNIGMGCHFLLQEIFPTQGSNLRLLPLASLTGRFFTTVLPGKPYHCINIPRFFYYTQHGHPRFTLLQ